MTGKTDEADATLGLSEATDRHQRVLILLLSLAATATVAAASSAALLGNPLFVDVAIATGLAGGALLELILAYRQALRPAAVATEAEQTREAVTAEPDSPPAETPAGPLQPWQLPVGLANRIRPAFASGVVGLAAIAWTWIRTFDDVPGRPSASMALLFAAGWLAATGLTGAVVRYLRQLDNQTVPEAPALCRGARVLWWLLMAATVSIGLLWLPAGNSIQVLHWSMLALDGAVAYHFVTSSADPEQDPLDAGVIRVLGGRLNVLASILDSAQQQLGIDLRSTWALTIVRRGLEPLVITLVFVGWLSTSIVVVGVQEQGLVERFGVPVSGALLEPGLHVQWPWPIDRVDRLPVGRVQIVEIGHEGEEAEGPENVLWAVQHAPVEFTLLLGDGRDLITIDAAIQFRIRDARAWRYDCQNPVEALSALGYRAVTRSTVNRTLSDALSENVTTLTSHMRDMIQQDADALGLGVEVLGFTVGGMHPPVPVATDYQAVVSAELQKTTAVVNAQTLRNTMLSEAQSSVLLGRNGARGGAAQALATAAGEAWSFRTLESQYRAAPDEYTFRRRLETLEDALKSRTVVVIDGRIQRDGGELWIGR
ncbi:MAG TPA: SPFH domain-containing protein [Vicinamibacterales bacterium]|nr:SPFH domain-containing protein [Vicinamibacterales bacterium]